MDDTERFATWINEQILADERHASRTSRALGGPTRALRDVAAKRLLVDRAVNSVSVDACWNLLRIVAVSYADHPDMREEWRL